MPKDSIEENIIEEVKEIEENKTEEPIAEPIKEPIREPIRKDLSLNSIKFTIRRVNPGGFYGVDEKGNGISIDIPKEYKNKNLKAGDIIFISKS